MMKKLIAALSLLLLAAGAHASVIGATATVGFYYPDTSTLYCSSGSAVIGAGVEYPAGCGGFFPTQIDIGDGTLTLSTAVGWGPAAFNGFALTIAGFDLSNLQYTGGSLGVTSTATANGTAWFNFAGRGTGQANFTFDAAEVQTSVPEPASIALLGLGLIGMGALRRKQA